MRKLRIATAMLAVVMSLSLGLSACSQDGETIYVEKIPVGGVAGFELEYLAGTAESGDQYGYNTDLFYRNESQIQGADPGAIYVSKEDAVDSYRKHKQTYMYCENGEWNWIEGHSEESFVAEYGTEQDWIDLYSNTYYMIVTGHVTTVSQEVKDTYGDDVSIGAFHMAKSNDFVDWKKCGLIDGYAVMVKYNEWPITDFWAPEFVRDVETGKYFIFYSAATKDGNPTKTYPIASSFHFSHKGAIAMSENPLGPYEMITAEEYLTIRAAKNKDGSVKTGTELRTNPINGNKYYDVYNNDGKVIGYKNGNVFYNLNGCEVNNDTPIINVGYYFPRYATDVPQKVEEMKKNIAGVPTADGIGIYDWRSIDLFPAIDDDGNLYCYFSGGAKDYYGNCVVKMIDYITPDWNTLCVVTRPEINSVIDNGTLKGENNGIVEVFEGGCNEAPEVIYHDGRWYCTYSYYGYTDVRYSIGVAVSDNPLGPFDKYYGAFNPVIGKGEEYNNYKAGTGHHVFVTAGEELFILYHATHNPEDNYDNNGHYLGRHIGVDRAIWKHVPELGYDMMFGNGATINLQPKPETYTGYTNVAKWATVTGNGDVGEVENVNDGMITAQPFSRRFEYGKTDGGLSITLTWDEAVEIKAFMIYNAGSYYQAFNKVNAITMKLAEKPAWYKSSNYNGYCYIKDLPVEPDDQIKSHMVVRHGSAAIAEFNPIKITEMTIYISGELEDKYTDTDEEGFIWEGYKEVHVSDIYIFGNKA